MMETSSQVSRPTLYPSFKEEIPNSRLPLRKYESSHSAGTGSRELQESLASISPLSSHPQGIPSPILPAFQGDRLMSSPRLEWQILTPRSPAVRAASLGGTANPVPCTHERSTIPLPSISAFAPQFIPPANGPAGPSRSGFMLINGGRDASQKCLFLETVVTAEKNL